MQDGFEQHLCVPDLKSDQPIRFVGWLVNDQALVIPGERIAEIMCDGCVVHVEATRAGVISLGKHVTQAAIQPGDLLARIQTD